MNCLKYIEWPKWKIQQKPANREYLKVKLEQVGMIMSLLDEYFKELFKLDGMRSDAIRDVMRYIVKGLIVYIWDLPASQAYHHAERFGLLRHSLEVAYLDAQKASREIAVNDDGVPSIEKTRKDRIWNVLTAWLIGLFHDIGKIFDVEIKYIGPNREEVEYHPFRAGILDFRLKYPKNVEIKWRAGRGTLHNRRNAMLFMAIVPLDFLKKIPPQFLIRIFDGLYSYKDAGDVESVKEATEQQNREIVLQVLRTLHGQGFQKDGATYVYALTDKIYAVVMPLFFKVVAEATNGLIETTLGQKTVENIFRQYGWLIAQEDFYYDKFTFRHGKRSKDRALHLAFVKSEPFEQADAVLKTRIRISIKDADKLLELLPDISSECFYGNEEEIAAKFSKENTDKSKEEVVVEDVEKNAQDNQKIDEIEAGIELILQKFEKNEYQLGEMNYGKHVGLIATDGLIWLLYPRIIDENFLVGDDLEDKSRIGELNKKRQQIMFGLAKKGYLVQFEEKGRKLLFQQTDPQYVTGKGERNVGKIMRWVRFDPARLLEKNTGFQEVLEKFEQKMLNK